MKMEKYNKIKEGWMVRVLIVLFTLHYAPFNASAQRMDNVDEHSECIKAVDEFCPAPGQFINIYPEYEAGDTYQSILGKCTNCLAGHKRELVSLGAYGGYITFHFDHSIANISGQADVAILGNAMAGGSEPGIVMVSKDVNKNGLPDDAWYELRGSASEDGTAIYNYRIVYQRPLTETRDVVQSELSKQITIEEYIPWTDNKGGSGFVHKNKFHQQTYYPQWVDADELVFEGTLLPPNGVNTETLPSENWVLSSFGWGYVDNRPNTKLEDNSFDFDLAVDHNRQSVSLDFVDFVRVYCAENQSCGWIGETSTEVMDAYDLHLEESLARVREAVSGIKEAITDDIIVKDCYSVRGIQQSEPSRGLNILRMNNGTTKKFFIK